MDDQSYTPAARGADEASIHVAASGSRPVDALASQILNVNKLRDIYIDSSLFRNAAWDIFLTIYVKRQEGLRATPALLSAVNRLTETECTKALEELSDAGLVVCLPGQKGERPPVVQLTDQGLQRVEAFLLSTQRV